MERQKEIFVSVILPIKFEEEIFFTLPEGIPAPAAGTWVKARFGNKIHCGIVRRTTSESPAPCSSGSGKTIEYKPLLSVEPGRPVTMRELSLWEFIADYYMCSVGEVFRAAYPGSAINQKPVKSRTTPEKVLQKIAQETSYSDITLSSAQNSALQKIESEIASRPVLLHGVTGSGKTEIYISLAKKIIAKGKSVLYLVPEIAMSKQLEIRLKAHFGERLRTFHHAQGSPAKKLVRELLSTAEPFVILGTRSSIFLPFSNLGLVIVDEEHDRSYKQEEPSPRYNGRDSALFLAGIHKAQVILGSATPSLETLYNCKAGKFAKVGLQEKYYSAPSPEIKIIDTIWTRKSRQMKGEFSQQLVNEIHRTIEEGGQVMIFRNIRSYSPVVQCNECGAIPKCPHCNIPLSYHKFDNTMRCHQCEYRAVFSDECPECHSKALEPKGAGTEKIEEQLREIFPDIGIARYDADVAQSKRASERILEEFSEGKIRILVGTQMISKGFDFKDLTLVAVIQADTILGMPDFRADERALQLFSQLIGRCGRREKRGTLIIQTNQKNHPVIQELKSRYTEEGDTQRTAGSNDGETEECSENQAGAEASLMSERSMFMFPPFVRMVNITLRDKNMRSARNMADELSKVMRLSRSMHCIEIKGPFQPNIEKVRDEYQMCVSVKFARDRYLGANKKALKRVLDALNLGRHMIVDVDPY